MNNVYLNLKNEFMTYRGASCLSILLLIWSFIAEKRVFNDITKEHIIGYVIVKCLLLATLYLILRYIERSIKIDGEERMVIKYALPYFSVLLIWGTYEYFFKHIPLLKTDDINVYREIIKWNFYPYHFASYMAISYILPLMLVPFKFSLFVSHAALQSFVFGYIFKRVRLYFKTKVSCLVCVLGFFSIIFLQNSYLINRMHYYALLYLVVVSKMTFDYLEHKREDKFECIMMMVVGAVLALWRKEGIYLVFLFPVLLTTTYSIKRKHIKALLVSWITIMLIVWSPEIFHFFKIGTATQESSHTYNTVITHMDRKGLNWEKYPKEKEVISKSIDFAVMHKLNHDFGDENYRDEWIAWKKGYIGIKSSYGDNFPQFTASIKKLIIKEPLLFLKTRVGSFYYSSFKSRNSIYTNLHLPLLVIVCVMFWGIVKKKYFFALLSMGLILHTFITTMLSPAGYFKYYLHMFFIGWFLLLLFILKYFQHKGAETHES